MSARNEKRRRKMVLIKKGGGNGNGRGGEAGEREAAQKKALQVVRVPFRGESVAFKFLPGEYALPVILSLVSLEDPRVNAILRAFGIQLTDVNGKLVFPEQPVVYPGDVQPAKLLELESIVKPATPEEPSPESPTVEPTPVATAVEPATAAAAAAEPAVSPPESPEPPKVT